MTITAGRQSKKMDLAALFIGSLQCLEDIDAYELALDTNRGCAELKLCSLVHSQGM